MLFLLAWLNGWPVSRTWVICTCLVHLHSSRAGLVMPHLTYKYIFLRAVYCFCFVFTTHNRDLSGNQLSRVSGTVCGRAVGCSLQGNPFVCFERDELEEPCQSRCNAQCSNPVLNVCCKRTPQLLSYLFFHVHHVVPVISLFTVMYVWCCGVVMWCSDAV